MKIKNYKLIKFINRPDAEVYEISNILKHLNPKPTKRKIIFMTFREVENLKLAFNRGDYKDLVEIIAKVNGIKAKKVLNMRIVDFFGYFNSVKKQLEDIVKAEENGLSARGVNVKWERVNGAKRMAKFGIFNTLERLSNGDITKYNNILDTKYSEIFTILMMKNEMDSIQIEMTKLK